MSKPWMYSSSHTNAVVGVLVYADENGAVLVKIDDGVVNEYVPCVVDNATCGMLYVDRKVCVYQNEVFLL